MLLDRDRGRALRARLAARARDARRLPADGAADGVVPGPLEPRLPPRARAHRPRHGDVRGGHLRDARRAVVRPRAAQSDELPRHQHALQGRELRDGRAQRPLLPGRRLPLLARDRDRARLRRLPAPPRSGLGRHAARLLPLPGELLRSGAAALAALQHVPLGHGRARQDHGGARRGARDRRRAGGVRAAADRRPRPLRGRPVRLREAARGAARDLARRARPGPRWRSSGRRAPASRRSPS